MIPDSAKQWALDKLDYNYAYLEEWDGLQVRQPVDDATPDEVVLRPLDSTYYVPMREEFFDTIFPKAFKTLEYKKDKFDCDDFAIHFHASVTGVRFNGNYQNTNAVGIVIDYSTAHAYNVLIFQDGFEFFEPQPTDYGTVELGEDDLHQLDRGFIIL